MESDKQKMRIISGKFKGKNIKFLKTKFTRPLKDSVKESIFNVIHHSKDIKVDIDGSNILDLYSGIGSFGLECLSRKAKKVTFVEYDLSALTVLKENLIQLSVYNQARIINDKIEDFLNRDNKEKYRIFFLDPPFMDKEYFYNLELIKKNNLFEKKHIIIIHREKNSNDDLQNLLNFSSVKIYGRSKIIFGTLN